MEELALKLLELIARSLHLRPSRLHGFFGDGQTTYMRMNRYPPCPRPDLALGLGRHKDSGALTILRQDDDVGGLDVRRRTDDEWVRVEPVRGSFVVNVGDVVQVPACRSRSFIHPMLRPAIWVYAAVVAEEINKVVFGFGLHCRCGAMTGTRAWSTGHR